MNVLLIDEIDVLGCAIISPQNLYMIGLNLTSFLNYAFIAAGDSFIKKSIPFIIGKSIAVEQLKLFSEIGYKCCFIVDLQVFIALCLQQTNELTLQRGFALIGVGNVILSNIFRYNGCFFR